jgi:hypothetical protein
MFNKENSLHSFKSINVFAYFHMKAHVTLGSEIYQVYDVKNFGIDMLTGIHLPSDEYFGAHDIVALAVNVSATTLLN